jgi:hypothetical protein
MKTIPCCPDMGKHVTCPDGQHEWEAVSKGEKRDGFIVTQDSKRCRKCHINKLWYDNYGGGK